MAYNPYRRAEIASEIINHALEVDRVAGSISLTRDMAEAISSGFAQRHARAVELEQLLLDLGRALTGEEIPEHLRPTARDIRTWVKHQLQALRAAEEECAALREQLAAR